MRNWGLFGRGGNVLCSSTDDFPALDPRDQDIIVKATIQTHSKSKEWAYEEEYRLTSLLFPGVPSPADRKRFVSDDFFAEVIIGIQCPEVQAKEIVAAATAK
jgi:hypothetical protein